MIDGPPKPIHELNPAVPAELEAICDKAMARDPAGRYADTMERADDLRAYLEGRLVRAWRTGPLVEFRKWVQRNRALAATIAAALSSRRRTGRSRRRTWLPHDGALTSVAKARAMADVRERPWFAETVRQRTIEDQRTAWDRAIASIGDPGECPHGPPLHAGRLVPWPLGSTGRRSDERGRER